MKFLFRLMRLFFLLVCVALMLACVAAWVFPGTTLLYPFGAPSKFAPLALGPPLNPTSFAAYRSGGHLLFHYCSDPNLLFVTTDDAFPMTNEKGRIMTFFYRWGLGYRVEAYHSGTYRRLLLPFWMPFCAAFLTVLLLIGLTFRRRRKRNAGLCPTCSYDLRAHKPGQRCPECGVLIAVRH